MTNGSKIMNQVNIFKHVTIQSKAKLLFFENMKRIRPAWPAFSRNHAVQQIFKVFSSYLSLVSSKPLTTGSCSRLFILA